MSEPISEAAATGAAAAVEAVQHEQQVAEAAADAEVRAAVAEDTAAAAVEQVAEAGQTAEFAADAAVTAAVVAESAQETAESAGAVATAAAEHSLSLEERIAGEFQSLHEKFDRIEQHLIPPVPAEGEAEVVPVANQVTPTAPTAGGETGGGHRSHVFGRH
jgi:colicin import membrane protein